MPVPLFKAPFAGPEEAYLVGKKQTGLRQQSFLFTVFPLVLRHTKVSGREKFVLKIEIFFKVKLYFNVMIVLL